MSLSCFRLARLAHPSIQSLLTGYFGHSISFADKLSALYVCLFTCLLKWSTHLARDSECLLSLILTDVLPQRTMAPSLMLRPSASPHRHHGQLFSVRVTLLHPYPLALGPGVEGRGPCRACSWAEKEEGTVGECTTLPTPSEAWLRSDTPSPPVRAPGRWSETCQGSHDL